MAGRPPGSAKRESYGSTAMADGIRRRCGPGSVEAEGQAAADGRVRDCQATRRSVRITGGKTSQLTMSQPPTLRRRPEENDASATEPKTRKSLAACTFARSSGR